MAVKTVIKSLIGTGIQLQVGGQTDVVVAKDVLVYSPDAYAIYLTGSNQTLTIRGTVQGDDDDAIKFGDGVTDKNHKVIVEASGMVIGDYDDALSFESMNPTVLNKGTIIGNYAIYSASDETTLATVVNSGKIIGVGYTAISISGQLTGVAKINNSGKIFASDYGVSVDDIRLSLVNTGLIMADGNAAISSDNGNDTVLNKGRIIGDVDLGLGRDLFDNRSGVTIGYVHGGDGNDRLLGGRRADALFGDEGNDRLLGGSGKDTLTGSGGDDAFIFNALSDRGDTIADFGGGVGDNDRILISRDGFGAGLSIGTLSAAKFQARVDNVAQDGNDRFIYRTTDDTLWFDKDGTGGANAVLIATAYSTGSFSAADIVIF